MKGIKGLILLLLVVCKLAYSAEPYMVPYKDTMIILTHGINSDRYTWGETGAVGEIVYEDPEHWGGYLKKNLSINEKHIKLYTSEDEEERKTMEEIKALIDTKNSKGSGEMLEKFQKMTNVLTKKNKIKKQKKDREITERNIKSFKRYIRNKGDSDEYKYFKKRDL